MCTVSITDIHSKLDSRPITADTVVTEQSYKQNEMNASYAQLCQYDALCSVTVPGKVVLSDILGG